MTDDVKALIDEARAMIPFLSDTLPLEVPATLEQSASLIDRLATALTSVDADLAREERQHTQTLKERDAVQDLFDELYTAIFGESPEYSNLFNANDAFNEMDAEISRRKSALSTADAAGYARGVEEAARAADADADCWAVAHRRHTHATPLTGRRIASSIRALLTQEPQQ